MALSVKASPSVIFLALRAIGSSTTITKGVNYAFRPIRRQSEPMSFSSVAASKDLVDTTLSKFLEYEINVKSPLRDSQVKTIGQLKYLHYQSNKHLTDSFTFEISNNSDWRNPQLEKKLNDGEKVVVRIFDIDDDTCENDKERDGSKKDIKAIPLTVEVHKPGKHGGMLYFDITFSEEDGITIQHLEVRNYRKILYYSELDEPRIREMDYELQRCLSKYLETIGITRNVASFLLESKRISNREEELGSLHEFKKLIEK